MAVDGRALLAGQPWLTELLQASREGLALFDPQGRIVRHNARLCHLAGRDDESLDGRPLEALLDDPGWPLALSAAAARGHWDGQMHVGGQAVEVRLQFARDGYGVLLCQDVSERVELGRRAESLEAMLAEHAGAAASARELLFEQSERLGTVYQFAVDALQSATVRDSAGRVCQALSDDLGAENVAIWLLDAAQEMLRRIAATGPRAKALPITCHRHDAPNVHQALEAGRPVAPGGGGLLGGFTVFPLPGREQFLGLVAVDISVDPDKIQVYAPHIATAINNAILAEELARANAQMRIIDAQKSEFLNVVAHDLRTPLACIRTYVDLMRMYGDEPPETYADFLAVITEETVRLGELLDNFLDLARIENRTLRYDLEPVRLDEIGAHFYGIYLAKAVAEEVDLAVDLPDTLPLVQADRRRLEQVFANLLSNAFNYTPPGGRVTVVGAADGDGVRVEVTDTGPGVPVEERERIFDRFRQGSSSDRAKGGSGLGLAIAKAIVTDHGGRIWIEDGDSGGARFVFCLPATPPPDAQAWRVLS